MAPAHPRCLVDTEQLLRACGVASCFVRTSLLTRPIMRIFRRIWACRGSYAPTAWQEGIFLPCSLWQPSLLIGSELLS